MSLEPFYLSSSTQTASPILPNKEAILSYPAADMRSEIHFDITFETYTEISGFAKLNLWMEVDGHDDMDAYVLLGRVDEDGRPLRHVNWPHKTPQEKIPLTNILQYQGATGMLRASHREWSSTLPSYAETVPLLAVIPDQSDVGLRSKSQWDGKSELYHPHFRSQKLQKGEIVKLEFTTWPIGMVFEAGEILRVRISGRDMCLVETPQSELQSVYSAPLFDVDFV